MVPAVNFETKTVDLFHRHDGHLYGNTKVNGFKAIIRSDTGATLGVATPRYSPIQIRDQWAALDPLIDAGLATIETLGSIDGGKKVWALVRINPESVPEWDQLVDMVGEIKPYALAVDVKTGKETAMLSLGSIRVVCNNTLMQALGNKTNCIKVKHIGDTASKIKEAADDLWGDMITKLNTLRTTYTTLKGIDLHPSYFGELVLDPITPLPTNPSNYKDDTSFERAVERAQNRRSEIYRLWTNGRGHDGDYSAWEALNGAVEALDHNESGLFRKPRNNAKINSMISGKEARIKQTITNNIMQLAA